MHQSVLLYTKAGSLRGFLHPLSNGKSAEIYLRIPYAKPPVGELRFEKPELLTSWDGVLDATKYGPGCPELTNLDEMSWTNVDEDCLTLNIFRPSDLESRPTDGWPVLVYVHGGGYGMGAAEPYGYETLANNFVSQGLIVVLLQYRLGVLGFASTGDDVLLGNLGLWDQATAFRWLYEFIGDFGGCPTNITAWGLSAGSSSVGLLALSKHSRDYIARTIQMSGSPFAEWALSDAVTTATKELARELGCDSDDSHQIKECLKRSSWDKIHAAILRTGMARREPNLLKYQPRIDGEFFNADLLTLLQTSPQKPTMMGFTEKEAMYFTVLGWYKNSLNKLYVEPSKFDKFNRSDFVNFLSIAVASKFGQHKVQALPDLVDFYLSDEETAQTNRYYYLEKYDQVLSDTIFIVPILRQAKYQVANDWPTYLYFNTYYNPAQFSEEVPCKGCTHGNEYPYMNGLFPVAEFEFTDADRQHQSFWSSAIGSFAKTGKPLADGVDWSPVSKENPMRHLYLSESLSVREDLMSNRLEFFNKLYAKYGSQPTIDGAGCVKQLAKN